MKCQNIGSAIAKGMFHPDFAGGGVLPAIIKEAQA